MIADGKAVAKKLKEKIINNLQNKPQKEVCFVIFGNDSASKQFIEMKCRFAQSLGIKTRVLEHSEDMNFDGVVSVIGEVVQSGVDGVVVQLPLPKGLPVQDILDLVPPELDIDVLSTQSKINYKNNNSNKIPPVSRAVMGIFDFYNIDLNNKEILVIGSGKLVGEPVASMLTLKNIPFKIVDKDTDENITRGSISSADIIISGAGSSYMIKPDMIKDGVVIVDAGTSEQNGKIVGDVDPICAPKCHLLTPVPGGVGPVTLASLFLNI